MQEYVLISSTEKLAERFRKNEGGNRMLVNDRSSTDVFAIETIGYQGSLADVYRYASVENGGQFDSADPGL